MKVRKTGFHVEFDDEIPEETSELRNDLRGESLFHRFLLIDGNLCVDGDLERAGTFFDDQADLISDSQEESVVADAGNGSYDCGRGHMFAGLEGIRV